MGSGRHAAETRSPEGHHSSLITSPFTGDDTAEVVSEGIDLTGRRAIVTGAASGIGVETARTLARRGAEVTIAARRLPAAQKVAADIARSTGNPKVQAAFLELTDRRLVADFADGWSGPWTCSSTMPG